MLYLKVLEASRQDYLFALKVAKQLDNRFDIKYYECKLKSVEERIQALKREKKNKSHLRLVKGY